MQPLRDANLLARLLLAWFVMAWGIAAAAPALATEGQWICSAGGGQLKLVVPGDDGSAPQPQAGLDCPLCAHVAAPPPAPMSVALATAVVQAPSLAVAFAPPPPRASLPPARGPPQEAFFLA